jgi:hypothetical protein
MMKNDLSSKLCTIHMQIYHGTVAGHLFSVYKPEKQLEGKKKKNRCAR